MESAPEPGTLGGWPEAVVVTLGQGGAATVLAGLGELVEQVAGALDDGDAAGSRKGIP